MHTAAPYHYRGLLDWEKVSRKCCNKMLNAEKPLSFLKGFAMHTVAPDRYRGLVDWEKVPRK